MLRRRRRLPWRRCGRGQVWPIWRSTIRSIRSRFLKKQLQDQAGKPFEAHGLSLKSRRCTPEDSISKAAARRESWVRFYNHQPLHQVLGNRTPMAVRQDYGVLSKPAKRL